MDRYFEHVLKRDLSKARTTAPREALEKARNDLVDTLPENGLGEESKFSPSWFFDGFLPLAFLFTS